MPTATPRGDLRKALWHLRRGGLPQLRTFLSRRSIRRGQARGDAFDPAAFEPWPTPERRPARPALRVGVILDDFSRTAFAPEWHQVVLRPSTWREQVAGLDLLFVESAWHGNSDAWQYALTGPSAPRADLVELVASCREAGVPTVFWNKEDPSHYADFLETARLFDHVRTTDSDRLPDYRRDLGHDRVGVMAFAAQPAIHNPVRPIVGHQARDIAFAGMYFAHRHPERREQMDLLLGAAAQVSGRMPYGLEIFSRYLGGDERYQFPGELGERVVGSLTYAQMLTAYRAYKVFLNVNSVVGSPSMCARRIFEITACGTPVVSTPSPAIGAFFPSDEVPQVGEAQEAEWTLRALVNSPELRDRMVHSAQRRIWRGHTYAHRVDDVLGAVGLGVHVVRPRSVSALVSSNRPGQLEHVVRTVAAQQDVDVELVLLTHGFEAPVGLAGLASDLGLASFRTLTAPSDTSLGACLNRLVEAAEGDVVAKMDDDDVYGPHYLRDQLNALGYSGAGVVGKQAHHMYLEAQDVTVVRFPEREHQFTDFVMGPTIVTPREVARAHPFEDVARGEDTAFLRRVVGSGLRVYSCDRFGFVQIRSSTRAHTWEASSAELLANSRVVAYGRAVDHVIF
ncbi:glycosyltransferase [Terrabacter sp. MAHUQ-38]|uniref:glycosyltransferase family protein n=1 Tax=unclassified Terrabacter TaxID=2630222 RepID=UPI00165E802D|nr:glycosyltransferase [Terrabacter sp. MAHUQ-38]MBC9821936.1 glycosyltransferase [Terrabacter sp. MAHUQ-38]